jgi:hypothetical protein
MEGDNYSKIVKFLSENGPSHPIQVGKVLNKDSFMTSAILSEVLSKGSVKKSKKNVGNTPIFYLEGQEDKAMKILEDSLNLIERKILKSFRERKVVADQEVTVQERFVLQNLTDFVVPLNVKANGKEMTIWKVVGVSNDLVADLFKKTTVREPVKRVEAVKRVLEPVRQQPEPEQSIFADEFKREKSPKQSPKSDLGDFELEVQKKIQEMGGEIVEQEVVRKGSELNIVAKFTNPFEHKCFIKARGKKRISNSDLSMAYTEGADRKMPVVLLTYGKLSKKSKEYSNKKFGDMLRVVQL